jgi:hypothetical protein
VESEATTGKYRATTATFLVAATTIVWSHNHNSNITIIGENTDQNRKGMQQRQGEGRRAQTMETEATTGKK